MAKKITGYIKLQILAGKATPAPPVGPALGQKKLNIMEFCKAFNAQTNGMPSDARIPVVITVYADHTFSFVLKKPPASYFLQKALSLSKGSTLPGRNASIGSISMEKLREIATEKMEDMNAYSIEKAIKMLEGTAKSMGIEVQKR